MDSMSTTRTHPLRLILAAAQPIVFGWAIAVVLGIFAYTLMADSPALGTTSWQDVASVTTGWWLTAFGGTLHFDGVGISLPPLLITLLTYAATLGLVRRLPVKDWIDVCVLTGSAAAVTALLGLAAPAGSVSWPASIGTAAVVLLAVATSKNRTDWFGRGFFTSVAGRAIYDGMILARRALTIGLIIGILVFVTATVLGWSEIVKINGYYIVAWHSNLMMWLFQLAYLPVFVLWAFAFVLGAGFAVGSGTVFSALGVASAPLPAIPLLGALPQPGPGYPWLLAVVALVLLLAGIRQARAFPDLKEVLVTGGIHLAVLGAAGALLAFLSQGSIGPDRMAATGTDMLRMMAMTIVILGIPFLAGMILGHRTSIAAYRDWAKRGVSAVKNLRNSDIPQEDTTAAHTLSEADSHLQVVEPEPELPDDPHATTAVTAQTAPESGKDGS